MITFTRKDRVVSINVQHGVWKNSSDDNKVREGFNFEITFSDEYAAELLVRQLQSHRHDVLEDIQRHYYNEGWKHAKSKKVAKRTWFPGNFKKV